MTTSLELSMQIFEFCGTWTRFSSSSSSSSEESFVPLQRFSSFSTSKALLMYCTLLRCEMMLFSVILRAKFDGKPKLNRVSRSGSVSLQHHNIAHISSLKRCWNINTDAFRLSAIKEKPILARNRNNKEVMRHLNIIICNI